ncbi:unnamed protein product [Effrenium voratum]|uniref:Uncharacterized protein n=1 Tax=Effrenium voratum TaxID=2562239 RepID=A0AA36ITS9_9DINO|nr:unnamed protein product [Effrenium voratum]CAJ1430957.1 unnamed protein product [Effrenium voratum]
MSTKRQREAEAPEAQEELPADFDEAYFEAYDNPEIHALMLGDTQRLGSYLAAIRCHRGAMEGKLVLDVGAGSAVLSMLCVLHGKAGHVFAVEASPGMASVARRLVEINAMQQKVTIIEGRVEEVELPGKVDIIISEWMGFYLVHESMLESVLAARDRWLKPQGLLLPSSGRIWAALVEAEELRKDLAAYEDLLGLDLRPVSSLELQRYASQPRVENLEPRRLLAEPVLFAELPDLRTLPPSGSRQFQAKLSFRSWRRGFAAAVAFWFDVGFGHDVVLKTDPGSPPTHWKQTVVYLGAFAEVEAGEVLAAEVTMAQSEENPRQYNISLETL